MNKQEKTDNMAQLLLDLTTGGWAQVQNLKATLALLGTDSAYKGQDTSDLKKEINDLIDAYLIYLGQIESRVSGKKYLDFPEASKLAGTAQEPKESLEEDTEKLKDHKWVNKGEDGTHGVFTTKKAADDQRKAMFANGYHEGFDTKTGEVTGEDDFNLDFPNTSDQPRLTDADIYPTEG